MRCIAILLVQIWMIGGLVVAAQARYIVEGTISGSVCTNYLIFSTCRMVQIDGVKGPDGNPYSIKGEFSSVSEHSGNRCWVHIRSDSWLSLFYSKTVGLTYLTRKTDGTFEDVHPEYLFFRCTLSE